MGSAGGWASRYLWAPSPPFRQLLPPLPASLAGHPAHLAMVPTPIIVAVAPAPFIVAVVPTVLQVRACGLCVVGKVGSGGEGVARGGCLWKSVVQPPAWLASLAGRQLTCQSSSAVDGVY